MPLDLAQATTADIRTALQEVSIQALVHAAGILRVGPLGALEPADGAAMWRLHVECASALADALVPGMGTGGRVVLLGSRTAAGAAGRSQYAASKAALVGLARSWAAELAPRGITVNVVAPGATETPMLLDPARGSVPPRLPPIGRFVQPDEVAALVAFLLGQGGRGDHRAANRRMAAARRSELAERPYRSGGERVPITWPIRGSRLAGRVPSSSW